ncbi:MAG: M36 family metallopeptidase [Myxococcales bacterium]|nr:M36 family metallopeptidase [Myxococcales bacterium]
MPRLLAASSGAPAPAGASFEEAARFHLRALAPVYGSVEAVVDGARALFTHDVGRGGVIVAFRQRVGDVEVFAGDVKVLLDRSKRIVAVAGTPHPRARAEHAKPFLRSRQDAVAGALVDLYGPIVDARAIAAAPAARRAGFDHFALAPAAGPTSVNLRAPARVKPVYFPVGDALVPAHLVEVESYHGANPDLDAFQYVIAADDGRVLYRRDMIAYDAFTYTVWADEGGDHRPADGPLVDYTPHPTQDPNDQGPTEAVKPVQITMEGFNTNPDGKPDPWLPADATESVGNNIDAYVDHVNPSGFQPEAGEFRAAVNGDRTFDYAYETSLEPLSSKEQSMGAIVQLFFDTNWLHDYWYDSGFNEAAGNAQEDNFGRGGEGGDRLQAQAQDGALEGSRNNANMMTPSDGTSPVMQMYLWTPRNNTGTLHIDPMNEDFNVSKGQFGPVLFDLSGELVVVDDGVGTGSDGCEPPMNSITGKVAVIDRGSCTFEVKVANAEAAGAIAAVIADNADSGLPPLGNDAQTEDPTIPTIGVSKADGAKIKAAIEGEAQIAHITGDADVERDGTIDNMIVAHEWGHYIHHRLVECGSAQCGAQSEGWGDFLSLHTMLREGDDLDGSFASTTYASFDPAGYFGIRRVPYSVDMGRNALTFRNIADDQQLPVGPPTQGGGNANSEVHNAGEIWTTMMFESYVALHKAHAGDKSFDEVQRSMSDYVVAGMMMTPPAPTYTDQRDAILLAISTFDEDDFMTVAKAFARRGAGTCAISPAVDSVDFIGVVEDFELRANAGLIAGAADDSAQSCDGDGVIDGGEAGKITATIYNNGVLDLASGALVKVTSSSPSVIFPDGDSLELGALPRLSKTDVSFAVAVAPGVSDWENVTLTVKVVSDEGCEGTSELALHQVIHGDIVTESATVDDVEVPDSPWEIVGSAGELAWAREWTGSAGFAWRGRDLGKQSDTSLASPPLAAAIDQPLVISFDHAYKFEFSDNIYWDGGVLEISTDGGMSWEDVAAHVDPGYNGKIASDVNPINGQDAYVDQNPSYPKADKVTLDFGTKFAGKAVRLRFRIGTDSAMGAPGWLIDNIAVTGITNTPFSTWAPDNCGMGGSGGETEGGTDGTGTATDGGSDSATATAGQDGMDDGGCGCSSEGRPSDGLAALGLSLLALGVGRRRRRA